MSASSFVLESKATIYKRTVDRGPYVSHEEAELSLDWKQWIGTNIARGCLHADLVNAMVHSGIDPALAKRSIENAVNHSSVFIPSGQDLIPGYSHEAPRIPAGISFLRIADHTVRVAMRIERPTVLLLDNVLTEYECDELVRMSQAKLKRSTIVDPLTGSEKVNQNRSSEGTHFMLNENALVASLDKRIAQIMHWPIENGEGLQILHYGVGGEYKPHYDYFPPGEPGSHDHLLRGGQRVSTLVIYLNEVDGGGETVFPSLNLSFVPRKGSAVYFEYCNSRGQVDPQTLHGGLPVTEGDKWIATRWMRQRKYSS